MPSRSLDPSRPASRPTRLFLAACLATAAATAAAAPASGQDAIWGARFGGANNTDTSAYDVAPVGDGSGDFYVCGIIEAQKYVFLGWNTPVQLTADRESGGYQDAFLARYHANGVPVWARYGRGPANDTAWSLAVSRIDHSVRMVGSYDLSQSGINSGGIYWDTDADDPVNPTPDVHLSRTFNRGTCSYVVCYEPDGTLRWAHRLSTSQGVDPSQVVIRSNDDFLVVGSYRGAVPIGDDSDPNPITLAFRSPTIGVLSTNGFVAYFDPAGNLQWAAIVEGLAGDGVGAAAVLGNGDVILIGETGRRDATDIQVFPGYPDAITLPRNGDGSRAMFVTRLDIETGGFTVPWLYEFGAGGGSGAEIHQIAVGPQDEVYITGDVPTDDLAADGVTYLPTPYVRVYDDGTVSGPTSFDLTAGFGRPHTYLARIDPATGAVLWTGGANRGSYSPHRQGPHVAATVDGVVFTQTGTATLVDQSGAGWYSYSGGSVHAKWDRDGTHLWAHPDGVLCRALTVLADEGCAITAGAGGGYLDAGLPTAIRLLPLSKYNNGYIARYDVAPATSIAVPSDMTPHCDPGLLGATVNFVLTVAGAIPGSTFVVTDEGTGDVLLSAPAVDGDYGVGPLFVPLGTTTIAARLVDSAGAVLLEESFSITVEDDDAPVLTGCDPVTIECTGEETLLLSTVLGVSASDDCDPEPTLTFMPAAVPLGTTTVTATARDESGNTTTCDFAVTVVDTTAPEFTVVPDDIDRECTDGVDPVIVFDVQARDWCGAFTLVCTDETGRVVDPSGTSFDLGVHTVTCTATDSSGNVATASFLVTIVDNTAPVLVAPDDMLLPTDPGECDATAVFAATAEDACDPTVAIVYTLVDGTVVASGDAFPVGTTVVTCTAQDTSGNTATADFSITVYDAEAPTFGGNVGGSATLVTDCAGADVALAFEELGLTVADNCDESPVVDFSPATLSTGTTWVSVTASDAAGNEAYTTVAVTVLKGAFEVELQRPLDANVDNEINPGRVVPVKVRLACDNVDVTDATVTIDDIVMLSSSGTPIVNVPVDDAGLSQDDGDVFRLAGSQYEYNLATAGWDDMPGVRYQITVRATRSGHVDTLYEIVLVNR